jgi:hypothetical protein
LSDFAPESIYKQLVQAGEEWADKEAAASILEETKKTLLAELMSQQNQASSKADREQGALSDPVYKLHLTNMNAARKDANRARVRYDSARVLAEMRRTQESTRRLEAYQR